TAAAGLLHADVLLAHGASTMAAEVLAKLDPAPEQTGAHALAQVRCLLALGQKTEARAAASTLAPRDSPLAAAMIELRLGHCARAVELLEPLLAERNEHHGEALVLMVGSLLRMGHPLEALALLDTAAAASPETDSGPLRDLRTAHAEALHQAGRLPEALTILQKHYAHALCEGLPGIAGHRGLALAATLLDLGRVKRAEALLQSAEIRTCDNVAVADDAAAGLLLAQTCLPDRPMPLGVPRDHHATAP
ncbi:tetratricopeptide repeat protein, partial [Actinocorallia lasiicapitis]